MSISYLDREPHVQSNSERMGLDLISSCRVLYIFHTLWPEKLPLHMKKSIFVCIDVGAQGVTYVIRVYMGISVRKCCKSGIYRKKYFICSEYDQWLICNPIKNKDLFLCEPLCSLFGG